MLYVGVDAHKAHSQMTVIDEGGGEVLRRWRVASSEASLFGKRSGTTRESRCEGGLGSRRLRLGPLYDWLEELTEEVLLAHPLK